MDEIIIKYDKRISDTVMEDVSLNWGKYTTFDKICPSKQTTLFIAQQSVNYDLVRVQNGIREMGFESKIITDGDGNEYIRVLHKTRDTAMVYFLENGLVIRFEDLTSRDILKESFVDKFGDSSIFIGTMPHIEERFQIRDSEINIISKTGLTDDSLFELESFWKFFLNDKYIGKALIRFHAEDMNDCAPTVILFEIFPEFRRQGFGTDVMCGIEEYMWKHGFSIMRIENTHANEFWKRLGYEIDLDEGEKILEPLDC